MGVIMSDLLSYGNLRGSMMYQRYFDKLKLYLKFSQYDIDCLVKGTHSASDLLKQQGYKFRSMIRTLEIVLVEDKNVFNEEVRAVNGRILEVIQFDLDRFINNERVRLLDICRDLGIKDLKENRQI